MNKVDLMTSGKITLRGSAGYGKIVVKGKVEGNEDVSAESMNVAGKISLNAMLSLEDSAELTGKIEIEKLIAKDIYLKGKIDIKKVKGENIFILVTQNGIIESIEADNITITMKEAKDCEIRIADFIFGLFGKNENYAEELKSCMLRCGKIYGKNVVLQNVIADEIVADNICLGVNCKVNKVTYKDSYKAHKSCMVKNIIKL